MVERIGKTDTEGVCPVTQLPVYQKTEWPEIRFGERFVGCFEIIDNEILHIRCSGKPTEQAYEEYISVLTSFIENEFGPQKHFVIIRDYESTTSMPSQTMRDRHIAFCRKFTDRLIAFISYNTPSTIKLLINVGQVLLKPQFSNLLAQDYDEAITTAVKYRNQYLDRRQYAFSNFVRDAKWQYKNERCSFEFRVLKNKAVFIDFDGQAEVSDVERLNDVYDSIFTDGWFPDRRIIRVVNYENIVDPTRKAKIALAGGLRRIHAKHSISVSKAYICGARPLIRAAIRMNGLFIAEEWHFVSSVKEAFEQLVNIDARLTLWQRIVRFFRPPKKRASVISEEDVIRLVRQIAVLSFEKGTVNIEHPPVSHPLSPIYETLDLVVQDTNMLIRERDNALSQAKKSEQEAKAANHAKSDFLANMSHEIRTPINGILGMNQMLLMSNLDETQRRYVETVHESADILLALVNDILDFSKVEAGVYELENIPLSLKTFIGTTQKSMAFQFEQRNIPLKCQINDDVPAVIMGDPVRLRQILNNLLGNALKFTHEGHVLLKVDCHEKTDSRATIQFEISDTGIGIRKEKRDELFEPFTQADTSTTRNYGGTGLGLAITKRLVSMMQGEISVKSEVDVGTTFTVSIPVTLAKDDTDTKPLVDNRSRPKDAMPHEEKDNESQKPIRLLLAEDNAINRRVAEAMLNKLGYELDIVHDGAEAITALQKNIYDIVLMDCSMPKLNGLDATRIIRDKSSKVLNHEVPVIALTANAVSGAREECLNAGMNDYLSKPITLQSLGETLGRWI